MELSSQTYEGKVSMQGVSEVCLVKILLHCSSEAAGMGSIKPLGEQMSRKPHSTEFCISRGIRRCRLSSATEQFCPTSWTPEHRNYPEQSFPEIKTQLEQGGATRCPTVAPLPALPIL